MPMDEWTVWWYRATHSARSALSFLREERCLPLRKPSRMERKSRSIFPRLCATAHNLGYGELIVM